MENQILDSELNDLETPLVNPDDIRYAGFWVRVGASLIDLLVLIPIVALNYYNLLQIKSLPFEIVIMMVSLLYKPLMEFYYSATLGKMAVQIKLVNYNFEKITLEQALIRYTPWLISNIFALAMTFSLFNAAGFYAVDDFSELGYATNQSPYYLHTQLANLFFLISVLAVAFSDKKQAIHDLLAKTYCIYKN